MFDFFGRAAGARLDDVDERLVFPTAPQLAPVRAGRTKRDLEEPGLDRSEAVELAQPAVHDHEDVLHRVLDEGLGNAHAAQNAPHESGVVGVDVVEHEGSNGHARSRTLDCASRLES